MNDTGGKTGINDVLATTKNGMMLTKTDISSPSEKGLYNLWMELPPSQRWSHKFYGRKGAIDHILLPHSLFNEKGIDYVNNSFGVFKASYLFTREGWINDWEYSGGKHKGRGYSDHLPIYAEFSTEPFKADKRILPTERKIEELYKISKLDSPIVLKNSVVIFKRGSNAIIKQSPKGRAIFIYGAARGLKEGRKYDLTVNGIGDYKGLREIIRIDRYREISEENVNRYYLSADELNPDIEALQNQVFTELKGVYNKGKFEINGRKIAIYFKKKRWKPKEGSKLTVHYAQLGYYNRPQLVVFDRKDFKIIGR